MVLSALVETIKCPPDLLGVCVLCVYLADFGVVALAEATMSWEEIEIQPVFAANKQNTFEAFVSKRKVKGSQSFSKI